MSVYNLAYKNPEVTVETATLAANKYELNVINTNSSTLQSEIYEVKGRKGEMIIQLSDIFVLPGRQFITLAFKFPDMNLSPATTSEKSDTLFLQYFDIGIGLTMTAIPSMLKNNNEVFVTFTNQRQTNTPNNNEPIFSFSFMAV